MSAALTTTEAHDLQTLEGVVQRGLATFIDVGRALAEIRDRKLYRADYRTFEEYCHEKWLLRRTRAYQMIDAAEVADVLSTTVDTAGRSSGSNGTAIWTEPHALPANERQARELVPLKDDDTALRDVWRDLRAEHGDKLTAAKVRDAVGSRLALERKVATIKSSAGVEWYTPARYVEAARGVMGGIDLDPASCAQANATVQATTFYTRDDDGLKRPWAGRVWLNPPYGKQAGEFVARLVAEVDAGRVEQAVVLVNACSTDTGWFQPLWDATLCFTDHRIDFQDGRGGGRSSSTFGSVFAYFGVYEVDFAREFRLFGRIVREWPA